MKVIMLFADCMLSGRIFHSAAEEVSKKCLPYLIVMFLLCISVVVEANLNGQVG